MLLAATATIAAVPAAAFVLMMATGTSVPGVALAALLATLAASITLAAIWVHDVHRIAEALRAVEDGTPAAAPQIPALEAVAREIERLARRFAQRSGVLEEQVRANDLIFERHPDPLLIVTPEHSVRRSNAAARTAFGAELAAVLRHPGLRAAIEHALQAQGVHRADLHIPVPVAREVEATVIWMNPGSVFVVLSDRTRERAVERTRADFVANASHELRTPLASLIGFIDTLRGPAADDPPAQARFLAIMAEQAQRMNRLIDDLLSLSRIELIEHQPPSEQVDLAAVVESVAAAFEPRVQQRRVQLETAIDSPLPAVVADYEQMLQVLQNLLDNAVKYGREGGHVRIALARAAQGGRWPGRPGLLLSVSDDGPGIPRAHVPRLTERFYRVDKGRSRSAGGTGLGLAIVKHIVSRHRGLLLIESEEGAGATFSVWLPASGQT